MGDRSDSDDKPYLASRRELLGDEISKLMAEVKLLNPTSTPRHLLGEEKPAKQDLRQQGSTFEVQQAVKKWTHTRFSLARA